jgi:hypothetical protein
MKEGSYVKNGTRLLGVVLLAIVLVGALASVALAANMPPVNLGSTASYALFAKGFGIASFPASSTVTGDVGIYYGIRPQAIGSTRAPGIYGLIVTGGAHDNDSVAASVAVDLDNAYADAWSRTGAKLIYGETSGTWLPGVYEDGDAESTIIVTGTVTLDAQGDPEAVFIFRTRDRLITSDNSRIVLINGARFCRVFWIARDARLGANSTFVGHLISENDITAGEAATVNGQLLAGAGVGNGGEITLNRNAIVNGVCTPRLPSTGYPPAPVRAEWPIAIAMFATAAVVLQRLRRRASDIR